jgi:hypothetical protein
MMRDNKQVGEYYVKSFTLGERKEFSRLCKAHDKDEQRLIAEVVLRFVLDDAGNKVFASSDDILGKDAVEIEQLMLDVCAHNKPPQPAKDKDEAKTRLDALQEFKFSLAGHLGKTVKELEDMDESEFFPLVRLQLDPSALSQAT